MTILNQQLGTTLFELLTALLIAGIITTLSISGFSSLLEAIRINSAVNELVNSFNLARQTSFATYSDIVICKTDSGEDCSTTAAWHDGWLIFSNLDQDNPPRIDSDEKVLAVHNSVKGLSISANRNAFILRPPGKRSTNGSFTGCGLRGSSAARAVIVSYTGKPRISSKASNGDPLRCPN